MSTVKTLTPEDLAPILGRSVATIKADSRRKPESLPPRLRIPGSRKLLWLEEDVQAWIRGCRS